jgi:hypothetical protein
MKFGSVIQLWDVDTGKASSVWGLSPNGTPTDFVAFDRLEVSNDGKSLFSHDINYRLITNIFVLLQDVSKLNPTNPTNTLHSSLKRAFRTPFS